MATPNGHGDPQSAFEALRYDRICRTTHSEAYLLSDGETPIGRIDLHFGSQVVHGLLILELDVPEDALGLLVQRLDDDLVWTADRPRDDFLVTVYRGSEVGVFSDEEDDEDEDDDDEE